jgi:acyl transferase domain-containing protein/acyl carrier protein/SAM-dependent methyltransferase
MYEFIGRVDQQVKIRGFRVELGEIESHLNRLPGVRESAVVLKTDAVNHPALIAFYVLADQDLRIDSGESLSEQLKCTLPDYMIPARFVVLADLPLTPNRKVDRKYLTQASDTEILEKFGLARATNKSAGTPGNTRALMGEVLRELILLAAGVLKADKALLDPHRPLIELGFDSIRFTSLSVALNRKFDLQIDATLFYHCKTLQGLAEFLLLHHPERMPQSCQNSPSRPAEYRIAETGSPDFFPTHAPVEPIAVIGMDARLPGADDLDEFWLNLTSGKDVIRQFPWERLDRRPPDSDPPIWGGFIEDVDKFDAPFFGISRREASAMDPRQRLFLETVWHAIEQSGYRPGELSGTNTGVFVGIVGGAEYSGAPDDGSVDSAAHLLIGSASSLIANRVSYHLNFRGPSAPIDTACSSSLVALHRAVVALQSGHCDLAVAGGVNLLLDPEISRAGAKTGMLSPDGRCKAFDARADGYVRGEGVVALLLRPLSKARAAGNPILAIIRGSAENHGGRAAGLTVPNPEAQSEVVAAALERAGLDSATLTYVETHGTGTQLGDPIEINGLKAAFDRARLPGQPAGGGYCGLGSVKTNIGHLEAAAGLAGVVKVLLALRHGEIPANLHFQSCNPNIRLEGSPFFIVARKLPWTRLKDQQGKEIPRRAGVSSFGFSGVNAHVVIEECPQSAERAVPGMVPPGDQPALIVLSARTTDRLVALATSLANHFERTAAEGGAALNEIAYTLQVGREAMAERIAFVAESLTEVCQKLRQVGYGSEAGTFRGNVGEKERLEHLIGGEAGESFLRLLMGNRDWARLGQLWVNGFGVDWKLLYPETQPRRHSLPAYPFDRRRYWLPARQPLPQMAVLGPLLDGPIPDWELGGLFIKRFGMTERLLTEHRVAGRSILPAAAFLELVRTAAAAVSPDQSMQFNSVVWLRPLEDSRAAETQVRLRREKEQTRFTVETARDGELWVHAQGEIRYLPKLEQPKNIDLPAIRNRCLHELEGAKVYERFAQAGMEYGPYFQSLECLWTGVDEVLGKLRLPLGCEGEQGSYFLHPSLLDGALQTAAGSTLQTDTINPRLPFSVDRVDLFGPLPEEVWVWVCRAPETSLWLADAEGRVAVKLSDYQTRPMKDPVPAPQSAKPASSSVLGDALRIIESTPATYFGLDPGRVDFECRGFALLESLGSLALLKTLQKIGIFRTAGEETDRESLRRALNAIPKYDRLCDTLVHFLKEGGFVEETRGGLCASASLAEPALQRALVELELEQERYNRKFPDLTPHGTLLWNCINALPQVVSGKIPATDVMFPNGSVEQVSGIYQGTLLTDYFNRLAGLTVRECIAAILQHGIAQSVRILEVGAGSGATTGFVAEAIREFADQIEYVYTDVSLAFKRHGQRTFGSRYPFMRFELLDIEKQVSAQGFAPESFDIVLGANVVHTTRLLHRSLQTIKELLKRNGVLVLLEGTEARLFNSLTYGLLDGWWIFQDVERRMVNAPLLTIEQWRTALKEEGFRGVQVLGRSRPETARLFQAVLVGESDGILSNEAVGNAAPGKPAQPASGASLTPAITSRVPLVNKVDPKRLLTHQVTAVVQEVLQADSEELRSEDTFESLGVDSILSVEIVDKLNARLPIKLRSTDLFNYPTITKLVERARELLTDDGHQQLLAETSPVAQRAIPDKVRALPSAIPPVATDTQKRICADREVPIDHPASVAIVGFSGQFPGAANVTEFWANLRAGHDAIREVPPDRWSLPEFYGADAKSAVKSDCKWGGFLPDPASFDPLFFNLSPREAELMDPQQRLFLMESWRALEDAGYADCSLDAMRCGVFVGCGASDYEHRLRTADDWAESHAFLGNASAILAARISSQSERAKPGGRYGLLVVSGGHPFGM